MANKVIHIIGGGTVLHLAPHVSLVGGPAYGSTARKIKHLCDIHPLGQSLTKVLHLTKMASGEDISALETNADIARLISGFIKDPATKIIFMSAAMCDFDYGPDSACDKYGLKLHGNNLDLVKIVSGLVPAYKVVRDIRSSRKDIFVVAWKTTAGDSAQEMYIKGLNLLKEASVNLVFVNDIKTRLNMIVVPEEAKYSVTTDRDAALAELVDIALHRSQLTFTRSTVVSGDLVPWNSPLVPDSLRKAVDYCIKRGAYKPFRGSTVGHFACKLDDHTFLTSIRKSNFNDLDKIGLVKVVTDGPDSVIAYGAKPSVGGQSQRIVFSEHSDYDCILHFHCPKKAGSEVPEVSQREYECGSHQCGENTSKGLQKFGNLSAGYLQEHGPNIVFNRSIDPEELISFIDHNFDLDEKTGGYVSLGQILNTPDTLEFLRGVR